MRAALRSLVVDTYDWFKKVVSDRRAIGGDDLAKVSDGRVFTGHQALDLKLIDEIGNRQQAVAWIGQTVMSQATFLAYIDAFMVMALIAACVAPLALLLPGKTGGDEAPG